MLLRPGPAEPQGLRAPLRTELPSPGDSPRARRGHLGPGEAFCCSCLEMWISLNPLSSLTPLAQMGGPGGELTSPPLPAALLPPSPTRVPQEGSAAGATVPKPGSTPRGGAAASLPVLTKGLILETGLG